MTCVLLARRLEPPCPLESCHSRLTILSRLGWCGIRWSNLQDNEQIFRTLRERYWSDYLSMHATSGVTDVVSARTFGTHVFVDGVSCACSWRWPYINCTSSLNPRRLTSTDCNIIVAITCFVVCGTICDRNRATIYTGAIG